MPKLIHRYPAPPTLVTLRRYGMEVADWYAICDRQRDKRTGEFTCPICTNPFGDRRLVIDHEHVKGFKARKVRQRDGRQFKVRVMAVEERRQHVRGIVHAWCNGWIRSWLTLERTESILNYLRAHESRRQSRKSA